MSDIKSIAVYCSGSAHIDPTYKQYAQKLGTTLAQEDIRLVFGGGRIGLMGVVADACMQAGGNVFGVSTRHLADYEQSHNGISELIIAPDMSTRKRIMFDNCDGFVVLPGGFGTLEETFEVITWRQIGLHDKPIVIVNVEGFWDPLKNLMDYMIEKRFAGTKDHLFYYFVDKVEDVVPLMRNLPRVKLDPTSKWF